MTQAPLKRGACAIVGVAESDIGQVAEGFSPLDLMAQATARALDDAGLSLLHVFPYSSRPGTPAARMPQLARGLVKERAARLREKGLRALGNRLDAMIGSRQTLLVEKTALGRTPCFMPVSFQGDIPPGALADVVITGRSGEQLSGILQ